MKKIYASLLLSCLIVFTTNSALAQVASATITSIATPTVGSTSHMISDTTYADIGGIVVSAGTATAQTWNYSSSFSVTADTYPDSTAFVAPGSNPGASSFPSATLAANQGGGWAYFTTGTSGMSLQGVYISQMGVSAALTYTPSVPEFPTPFTYSNSASSISTATASATYGGVFPISIVSHQHQTITADAFGTVITPAGTYSNTVRYKIKNIESDSVTSTTLGTLYSSIDSTIQYSWYQNTSTKALVMSVTLSASNDSVRKAQYLQGASTAGINTIKQTLLSTNLYPNPASGVSYLSYENLSSANVSASIYDVTGRQVATLINNQQQAAGKQMVSIDVNNLQLPQGLYMVQLTVNGAMKTLKLNAQ